MDNYQDRDPSSASSSSKEKKEYFFRLTKATESLNGPNILTPEYLDGLNSSANKSTGEVGRYCMKEEGKIQDPARKAAKEVWKKSPELGDVLYVKLRDITRNPPKPRRNNISVCRVERFPLKKEGQYNSRHEYKVNCQDPFEI
jgi:hypothetical protein